MQCRVITVVLTEIYSVIRAIETSSFDSRKHFRRDIYSRLTMNIVIKFQERKAQNIHTCPNPRETGVVHPAMGKYTIENQSGGGPN